MADNTPQDQVEVDSGDGRGFQPVEGESAMMSQLRQQLGDLDVEDPAEVIARLPKDVQARIEALRLLQDKHAEIEEEFEKERKQLELKYEKKYQPLYAERAEYVAGKKDVDTASSSDIKGVPGFWLRAFLNHSVLADLIHEQDLPAFEYLVDVRSESHAEDNGFKLTFEFATNPYFTNTTLTKEYDIGDASDAGEAVLRNVHGTVIEWKDGKNLCETTRKVKQKAKGDASATRVVSKTEACDSFFQFFAPAEMPEDDDDEQNELIMRQLSADFEIGFTIHETIIPQALLWFTGEAVEEDSDWEEDDEDEEEDESEDEEGDEPVERVRRSKRTNKGGAEKPPECKNQ